MSINSKLATILSIGAMASMDPNSVFNNHPGKKKKAAKNLSTRERKAKAASKKSFKKAKKIYKTMKRK